MADIQDISNVIVDFNNVINSIKNGPLGVDQRATITTAQINITRSIMDTDDSKSLIGGLVEMTKKISVLSNLDTKNLNKSRKNINELSKTAPIIFKTMVDTIQDINDYIGSQEKIKELLGWTESGQNEFLIGEKNGVMQILENADGEKLKNPLYVKPHFAAETGLFKIGEYFTLLFGSLEKITSIEPTKFIKGAAKMNLMAPLIADLLHGIIDDFVEELSDFDTSKLKVLVGDEQTETRFEHIVKDSYSVSNNAAVESKTNNDITSTITKKNAGVLEVMTGIFGLIDKIVNFPIGNYFVKLLKFRIASGLLASQVSGSVDNFIDVLNRIDANKSTINKDSINDIIKILDPKSGVGKVYDLLIDVSEKYKNLLRQTFWNEIRRSVVDPIKCILAPVDRLMEVGKQTVTFDKTDEQGKVIGTETKTVNVDYNVALKNIKTILAIYTSLEEVTNLYRQVHRLSLTLRFTGLVTRMIDSMVNIVVKLSTMQDIPDAAIKNIDKLKVVCGDFLYITKTLALAALLVVPAMVGVVGLSLLVVASSGLLWLVSKLFKNDNDVTDDTTGHKMPKTLQNLMLMGLAFAAFAGVLALIPAVSADAWRGMLIISAMILVATGVLFLVSLIMRIGGGVSGMVGGQKFPPMLMNLILMATAFLVFAGILWLISKIQMEFSMLKSVLIIAGAITAAALVVALVGALKKWIILGSLVTILVAATFLLLSYTLKQISETAQNVSFEDVFKFLGLIAPMVGVVAAIGIPVVAGLVALGSGVVMMLAFTYLKLCEVIQEISKFEPDDIKKAKTNVDETKDLVKKMVDNLSGAITVKQAIKLGFVAGSIMSVIKTYSKLIDLIDKLANLKVATEWDKNGNPIKFKAMDTSIFADAVTNAEKVCELMVTIGNKLTELDDKGSKREMRRGKRKMKIIAKTVGPLNQMLDFVKSLATEYELPEYKNGEPTGKKIKITIGDFVNDYQGVIISNIESIFGLFDYIGDYLVKHGGGYEDDKGEKKKVKRKDVKQLKRIGETVGPLMDMLSFVKDLADGSVEVDGKPMSLDKFMATQQPKVESTIGDLFKLYDSIGKTLSESTVVKDKDFDEKVDKLNALQEVVSRFSSARYSKDFDASVKATQTIVDSVNGLNESKIDKLNKLMQSMSEFGRTMNDVLKDVMDEIIRLTEDLHDLIAVSKSKSTASNVTPAPTTSTSNVTVQQPVQQPVDITTIEDRLTELTGFVRQISANLK